MAAGSSTDFIVRRENLREFQFAQSPARSLVPGQVRLAVDAFAFTANNVTYAAFGKAMSYWEFFPAAEGWGAIPVWGFGTVAESTVESVRKGERFYGYYPMSDSVIVQAERVDASGFRAGEAHRKPLAAVYNQYLRTTSDPGYDASREAEQILLRPLFVTSFLIDDFLADNSFFGAKVVVLSSASSKTAYGTAFELSRRDAASRPRIVGLTSAANVAFTESLGCYDRVIEYGQLSSLAQETAVYVDMSGDSEIRRGIHTHFGERLKHSCAVGGTHWEALGSGAGLPGPRPALFFAPAQAKKRLADWGPKEFQARIAKEWKDFVTRVTSPGAEWMKVVRGKGPADVERTYLDVLDGRARPSEGHVLSL